jgi:hypothetical protein
MFVVPAAHSSDFQVELFLAFGIMIGLVRTTHRHVG